VGRGRRDEGRTEAPSLGALPWVNAALSTDLTYGVGSRNWVRGA